MSTYSKNYALIDWSKDLGIPEKRSRGSRFVKGVISDYLPDLIHPCTGKRMDSKSEFRKVTKAKGGIEVGNETMRDRRFESGMDSHTRKADISQAMRELGV